ASCASHKEVISAKMSLVLTLNPEPSIRARPVVGITRRRLPVGSVKDGNGPDLSRSISQSEVLPLIHPIFWRCNAYFTSGALPTMNPPSSHVGTNVTIRPLRPSHCWRLSFRRVREG